MAYFNMESRKLLNFRCRDTLVIFELRYYDVGNVLSNSRNCQRANRVKPVGAQRWCGAAAWPSLRQPIWVEDFNVWSLKQYDHHLLLGDLCKICIPMAERRPGSDQISVDGYIDFFCLVAILRE